MKMEKCIYQSSLKSPTLGYFALICFLGAASTCVFRKFKFVSNFVKVFYGVIIAVITMHFNEQKLETFEIQYWYLLFIQYFYIPIFVFCSAISFQPYIFHKVFKQCMILGISGTFIIVVMTSVTAQVFLFERNLSRLILSSTIAIILNILSSKDTMDLLMHFGSAECLYTLATGEVFFNRLFSLIAYDILLTGQRVYNCSGEQYTILTMISTILSPIFGYIFGKISLYFLLNCTLNTSAIVISLCMIIISSVANLTKLLFNALAIGSFALTIISEKLLFEKKTISSIEIFLKATVFQVETIALIHMGILLYSSFLFLKNNHESSEAIWIQPLLIYFCLIIYRSIVVVILKPILQKLGYGFSWQFCCIIIFSRFNDVIAIFLLLHFNELKLVNEVIYNKILIHTVLLIVLSQFLNYFGLKFSISLIGIDTISYARKASMAYAIKLLNNIITSSKNIYKRDPLYASVSWEFVEIDTTIPNPYETTTQTSQITELPINTQIYILSRQCPKCQEADIQENIKSFKEVKLQSEKLKKFQDLQAEIYTRSTKSAKMNYWHQYRCGLIRMFSIKTLSYLANKALDKSRNYVNPTDVKNIMSLRNIHLFLFLKSKYCYYIELAIIILLCFEVILKLLSKELKKLLKSWWNKIDFCVLLAICILIPLSMNNILEAYNKIVIDVLLIVRLFNIFQYVFLFKLLFKKYVNWKIKIHMYKSYDLGQGFISGQKHIEENCNYLVNYKPTSKIMKEIISSDQYEIIKEMVNIHQKYPEVVIAIKTQITCRKVLNDAIDELMSIKDVMLEEQDYELLQKILNQLIEYLYSSPIDIPIKLKHPEICTCAKWTDKVIYKYLQNHIQFKEYPPGTILCKLNTISLGVYVISSGLVKVTGTANKEKEKSEVLQNSDSHLYFTSNGYFEEYKTVTESLGLFGLLTRRKLVTEAICKTKVEAAFIPMKKFVNAAIHFKDQPNLLYNIWKSESLKIAVQVLQQQPPYWDYSEEKLMKLLQDAALPDFRDYDEFVRPEYVLDVVLIQGKIINNDDDEEYYGPVYIPRYVSHFIFTNKKERFSRLVVLCLAPTNKNLNMQFDWMQQIEDREMKLESASFKMSIKDQRLIESMQDIDEETSLNEFNDYYDNFRTVLSYCPKSQKW
ncbi:sperm-specific sodium:proton exchanger-like isoform X3 [Centruroides vittatus]|uniref:sperm-specific sodium:proton exchanger-like isoform X3 n=1 Tax=Centruroides vittatus TaxID=120091 RepID=UPI00350F2EAD